MKIQRHPRIQDIAVGDEVLSYHTNIVARVHDVFPAAVCVRIAVVCRVASRWETREVGQVWRADEIENVSRCCYCGARDDLHTLQHTAPPRRICGTCHSVMLLSHPVPMIEAHAPFGESTA
jgi:hypothetical protein